MDYLLEWQATDARFVARSKWLSDNLAKVVNESDVACFLKPGGLCPFCNMATSLLVDLQRETSFTLHFADLLSDERETLAMMLKKDYSANPRVTFPAIFIFGEWLPGGYEELKRRHNDGSLLKTICQEQTVADRKRVLPLQSEEIATLPASPQLFHQAGGGPWLTFQTKIYGNVLRGIALLQICVLLPAHLLDSDDLRNYSIPLLAILFIDSCLFVAMGPTPFAPLGVVSTCAVWQRRGSIVPLLPYKVTIFFYAVASMASILCPHTGEDASVCKLLDSDGLVYTLLFNSIYLLVFRF